MTAHLKTPGGQHVVQYGTTPITFDLLYSGRKTIALRVYPDQSITVDAPTDTPLSAVLEFVHKHGAWVKAKLPAAPPPVVLPRRYVTSESYRYLGRQYMLKVEIGSVERITLTRGRLTVQVHDRNDYHRIAALISGWYRRHADRVFRALLTECYQRSQLLGIPSPNLHIRLMKSRWGSCTRKGRITLNLKLIQAPPSLIRYVIYHELCHLKEFNHSTCFWALLTRLLPEWRSFRTDLNQYEFNLM